MKEPLIHTKQKKKLAVKFNSYFISMREKIKLFESVRVIGHICNLPAASAERFVISASSGDL